ncbi:unnamed protein product [Linum trigynum]|uniref:RNase H type-1 domain-containing protein n=1 Tax=Linum trigynum TaxID=586398 RepID=A0AAV2CYM8_9ROSI
MRVVRLMCVLWRIWKGWNSVVFEGQQTLPSILRQEFLHQVSEWEQLPQGDGNGMGEPSGGLGADHPAVAVGSPMLVELSTLRDAIRWCQHRGLEAVTIEGDAKIVIDKVNAGDVCAAAGGALFEEIRHLLLMSPGFRVQFVDRQNSRVVHMVTKKALSLFPASCNGFDFCGWLRSQLL